MSSNQDIIDTANKIIGGEMTYEDLLNQFSSGVAPSVVPNTESEPGTSTDPEIKTDYTTWFQQVVTGITELPQKIADAFKSLLQELFVPAPEFIPNKVSALQAKYTFLKPIQSTFTDLKLFFQTMGTTPPIIYIDLGAATSFYPMGGKVKFIDLTWFSQYKGTSDFIIGSFLWLWFAWRMLHAIPGIIQGTSGMWGHFDAVPDFTFRPVPTSLPGGDDPKLLGATSPLPSGDKKRLGSSNYRGSRSKREYFKHHGG